MVSRKCRRKNFSDEKKYLYVFFLIKARGWQLGNLINFFTLLLPARCQQCCACSHLLTSLLRSHPKIKIVRKKKTVYNITKTTKPTRNPLLKETWKAHLWFLRESDGPPQSPLLFTLLSGTDIMTKSNTKEVKIRILSQMNWLSCLRIQVAESPRRG